METTGNGQALKPYQRNTVGTRDNNVAGVETVPTQSSTGTRDNNDMAGRSSPPVERARLRKAARLAEIAAPHVTADELDRASFVQFWQPLGTRLALSSVSPATCRLTVAVLAARQIVWG